MRETLGKGKCVICGSDAEIRKNVKGKLYAYCAPSCGLIQATGQGAQARFQAMLDAGAPVVEQAPPDDLTGLDNPAGQPDAVPAPKPGLFASILNAQIL